MSQLNKEGFRIVYDSTKYTDNTLVLHSGTEPGKM